MYAPLQNKCPIITLIDMGKSDTYSEEEHIVASAARRLATIHNTIVARGFAAEAPIYSNIHTLCFNGSFHF
jgi:hypothetical protein